MDLLKKFFWHEVPLFLKYVVQISSIVLSVYKHMVHAYLKYCCNNVKIIDVLRFLYKFNLHSSFNISVLFLFGASSYFPQLFILELGFFFTWLSVVLVLFSCGLLNSKSDYVAQNGWMTDYLRVLSDSEGDSRGLVEFLPRNFPGRSEKNHRNSSSVVSVPAKIRKGNL